MLSHGISNCILKPPNHVSLIIYSPHIMGWSYHTPWATCKPPFSSSSSKFAMLADFPDSKSVYTGYSSHLYWHICVCPPSRHSPAMCLRDEGGVDPGHHVTYRWCQCVSLTCKCSFVWTMITKRMMSYYEVVLCFLRHIYVTISSLTYLMQWLSALTVCSTYIHNRCLDVYKV